MAFPRSPLRDFLIHAKSSLRSAIVKKERVTLVIGNESADLDSLTCSLLFSYLRSIAPPKQAFTSLYIPVTNIPAADIALRPEFAALLTHANLEADHLITLDDLPELSSVEYGLVPENTRWILVDHNALQGKLGVVYTGQVCGVIDHHDEENRVPFDTGDEPRIIKKSGSCTSLVTGYLRETWDVISSEADNLSEKSLWDAQLAKLALASVLIDTTNATANQKTTEYDVKAMNYLEAKIKSHADQTVSFNRNRLFEQIDNAKKDIGRLTLHDILKKDYKQWDENGLLLGISSVVKPIEFMQEKAKRETSGTESSSEAFLASVRDFARYRQLGQFALMTASSTSAGELQRELLLWAFTRKGIEAARHFMEINTRNLGLKTWQGPDGSIDKIEVNVWRTVWWQRRVEHSRKQVAPLLREAIRNM